MLVKPTNSTLSRKWEKTAVGSMPTTSNRFFRGVEVLQRHIFLVILPVDRPPGVFPNHRPTTFPSPGTER